MLLCGGVSCVYCVVLTCVELCLLRAGAASPSRGSFEYLGTTKSVCCRAVVLLCCVLDCVELC